ncbi:hypothetical protein [Ideonella sp.]|uniref:hypothetical protein n=1 Tax=Ideonella sp. TaxID=1929293 RepID=UPI003BB4CE15
MIRLSLRVHPALAMAACLAGCGGGGGGDSTTPDTGGDAVRIAAAQATAARNPACAESLLGSFYWEVGDKTGARASGSVGASPPDANTLMSIASASKWMYAAYVVQKVGVRADDVPYLNFTSGYSRFGLPFCPSGGTVADCLDGKDDFDAATLGRFAYDGGHMQVHAVRGAGMGLGPLANAALAAELKAQLGSATWSYSQPQLAGGVVSSAAAYASFLRRILNNDLAIGAALGSHKVCTNPSTCSTAANAPVPETESWNYSLGHWVEDDPRVGDHAYSSAGAFGFYPWIDRSRSWYGVVARLAQTEPQAGYHSAQCGRLIRQAWVSGTEATSTVPSP